MHLLDCLRRLFARSRLLAPALPQPIVNPASDQLITLLNRWGHTIDQHGQGWGELFVHQMLNTWQTTVHWNDGEVFIVTGDIEAMWLRDSSTQMRPFLVLAPESAEIRRLIAAVIARQWAFIEVDPYANAFNPTANHHHWEHGDLATHPQVFERKYEVDSLGFPIQLAWQYWQVTGHSSALEPVHHGLPAVLDLWHTEQDHFGSSTYRFIRPGTQDTLGSDGRGTPVASTGMTWSGFRPSDDPCQYGYNIPAQFFASYCLGLAIQMCEGPWSDPALAHRCRSLKAQIDRGIKANALAPRGIWCYETDGLGHQLLLDDANMPSLLSLPLCSSIARDDPTYLATRQFILSPQNPYWFQGDAGEGIGSPHTPDEHIWPIALAVQGLTSTDPQHKLDMARLLASTHAGTKMMHESFHVDDPSRFTRSWFSWANSMFCELLLDIAGHSLPGPIQS